MHNSRARHEAGCGLRHCIEALPRLGLAMVLGLAGSGARAQSAGHPTPQPDLSRTPTLYVVPYAHLDTQWRWEFPQTITEYLLKTMRVNFDYIDRYPHYIFNWTGANRYRLMKEYFPADYARMKRYVAAGRWFPAGSSVEEGDVNLPSAEGIFRQVLYGNDFFRAEFGKASAEYMLPDCFGFPASLPSILAHAGVRGFSTQKLSAAWQPAPLIGGPHSPEQTPEGIPFNVGRWIGPDGNSIVAALNPGAYESNVYTDLSREPQPDQVPGGPQEVDWVKRVELDGKVTSVYADYHYVGTGDIGGATQESTVKLLEAIVTRSDTVLPARPANRNSGGAAAPPSTAEVRVGTGPLRVVESAADQMFKDISPAMATRLPSFQGDLELINHSAGSLTSQAYHKRWVTRNEGLADAAEKSSVAAAWLGARTYPQQRLNQAWMLALGGHFHDSAAGTATPRAYEFAWNDDAIVANQFEEVFRDATEAVSSGLDTRGAGVPVVVFNPLNIARQDVVEARVAFPGGLPASVVATDAAGRSVPTQIEDGKVIFVASAPSVGYTVYTLHPGSESAGDGTLRVTESSLENARYRVALNGDGDIASIFDKSLNKELLAAPMRLAIMTDRPLHWPAWNMDFDQEQAAPRSFVSGPARVRISERGPVRVAIEVARETEGSTFVQTVSLSAGDAGNRVEFRNAVDWKTLAANLKSSFDLAPGNPDATYNWDVGTVERSTATERQFEVASHRWVDLTDRSGTYGATLLTDAKNGSDKRDDHTIRLTLLRTPGIQTPPAGRKAAYTDQANQDWGHHEFTFGLTGHAGDWRSAQTDWQAYRLSSPLVGFQAESHAGPLGKTFSLLRVSNPRIRVLALKKAEASDEIVVRMVEMDGKPANGVTVSLAAPLASAREVNAQEQPIGPARIGAGSLVTSFGPYQPRTFAVRLTAARVRLNPVQSKPVGLAYDVAATSLDDTHSTGGGFDGKGNALAAEMLPPELTYDGVRFKLAEAGPGQPSALSAKGQTIALPDGRFNRVYLLAASAAGDRKASFQVGGKAHEVEVEEWGGFIGQWDTRLWNNFTEADWATSAGHAVWPPAPGTKRENSGAPRFPEDFAGMRPGYIKPASLAWFASHHHTAEGLNEPYQYSYLFAYALEVPAGARSITLPSDDSIRILAISTAQTNSSVTPVQPLFDTLQRDGTGR